MAEPRTGPAFAVPKLSAQEHESLVRLSKGEAEPHQQLQALEVIVKKFSQPQELLYIPGSFDETAFVQGRAFVASRIRYFLKRPVGVTQAKEKETSDDT